MSLVAPMLQYVRASSSSSSFSAHLVFAPPALSRNRSWHLGAAAAERAVSNQSWAQADDQATFLGSRGGRLRLDKGFPGRPLGRSKCVGDAQEEAVGLLGKFRQ